MDLATIVGLIGGIGMIIMAMVLGGDVTIYYNLPSVLIVVVGFRFVDRTFALWAHMWPMVDALGFGG